MGVALLPARPSNISSRPIGPRNRDFSPEGGDPIHCVGPSIFKLEAAPKTGLPHSHFADRKTETQRGK